MNKDFWVYVIRSQSSNRIYIGHTEDLERRLLQHNDPQNTLSLYTKRFKGPWEAVYSERHSDRSAAMRRERYLKNSRGRAFLKSIIPR
jgi:putative endonuclease